MLVQEIPTQLSARREKVKKSLVETRCSLFSKYAGLIRFVANNKRKETLKMEYDETTCNALKLWFHLLTVNPVPKNADGSLRRALPNSSSITKVVDWHLKNLEIKSKCFPKQGKGTATWLLSFFVRHEAIFISEKKRQSRRKGIFPESFSGDRWQWKVS